MFVRVLKERAMTRAYNFHLLLIATIYNFGIIVLNTMMPMGIYNAPRSTMTSTTAQKLAMLQVNLKAHVRTTSTTAVKKLVIQQVAL